MHHVATPFLLVFLAGISVSAETWRGIVVAANQHLFSSRVQSAASFAPFRLRFRCRAKSVRLRISRANSRLRSGGAAHRPESCASLRTTICTLLQNFKILFARYLYPAQS